MSYTHDEYWLSPSTGNVFQVVRRSNGYVVANRIGIWDTADGSFEARQGIGFAMREEYLRDGNGLTQVVRLIGDVFRPMGEYDDLCVLREEVRRES